ncbi:transporter substrate-binding domain-containing protein [Microvirga sp. VF16]|uniref:transporter substrate-binding domain-containing protein n=1 Tax=Microvirga sp. VF16 TaxID=2807101 RepID=UPI00193E393A|nr:transporter substrate-binding domain-containing protein [Microvirga sp. VF16]QRM32884.1 transporter substrate-binding domain-containing protein [Microvirga sp. VF16]
MKNSSYKVLLAAVGLTAILYGPASAQENVVVGLDASNPPFASVGAGGKLQGFDVDLVNAICAVEKLKCELRNIPWDGIFAALDSGKLNVVAAGLNITEERQKKYAMPGPYLNSPFAYIVTASSTLDGTNEGLSGKTVGTVAASAIEKYLNAKKIPGVNVSTYDSWDAAVLDLDSGRLDAVLGELVSLQVAYINAKPGAYKIVGEPISDPTYSGRGKGLAIRKDDKTLSSTFDKGLAAIIADGTHAQLTKKWFGAEMPAK